MAYTYLVEHSLLAPMDDEDLEINKKRNYNRFKADSIAANRKIMDISETICDSLSISQLNSNIIRLN